MPKGAVLTLKTMALRWRWELGVAGLITLVTLAGFFAPVQNAVNDGNFEFMKRPASGEIVIVAIDAKSIAAIDAWPWPRGNHAAAIDRLREAGADLIALDIDFSSPSTAVEDQKLADAIKRATGHLILPSFAQHDGPNDELLETHPLALFRDDAMIGNANVFAPEGVARYASLGLYLPDGRYRPTFGGLLGQQDHALIDQFSIDFAIDPATFPTVSYIDVLRGTFAPGTFKGKRVVIGATAVELGDRVPVPVYGVIPGVELQALISESAMQGRMLVPLGFGGALALMLAVLFYVRPTRAHWTISSIALPALLSAALLLIVPPIMLAFFPAIIEAVPALAALGVCVAVVGGREFAARSRAVLRERAASNLRRAMITLIVEQSSDGVVVTDRGGRIELINDRASEILNATPTTLLSREISTYLPLFDSIDRADGDDEFQRHTEFKLDGDVLLEMTVRRLTLADGKGLQALQFDVYTMRDVTARRRAEEAERRAHEERLMAERAKSNFIANMSHELRTPLNAVIGFSEIMAAEALGPMGTKAYLDYAQEITKSGRHLLGLVNNVLELSRIDNDDEHLDTEEFDFEACTATCVDLIQMTRDYKGQTIDIHPTANNAFVRSVPRLVKHMLVNLLSNAVKFTPADGKIGVTSWAEGDDFAFEVSDNGVGIDPDLLPNLTTMFYRSNTGLTREHDGLGVGLFLVKRALERIGGTLQFDTAPGKGTRVRVRMPNAAALRPAPAEADAA